MWNRLSFVKKSASFQRQQQIIYEVKLALEPSYHRGEITKDDFKQITKKSVEKVCGKLFCMYMYFVCSLSFHEGQTWLLHLKFWKAIFCNFSQTFMTVTVVLWKQRDIYNIIISPGKLYQEVKKRVA